MLDSLRERASKWVLWVILVVVGIPFVFWGVQDYPSAIGGSYVAKADGITIGSNQLEQAFESQYARLAAIMGPHFTPSTGELNVIRQQALETLVQKTLLLAQARHDGIRVNGRDIARAIRGIPSFRENHHFSMGLYEDYLHEENLTPAAFENQIRESLLLTRLGAGIAGTAFLPPLSIRNRYRYAHESRPVRWVEIPTKRFLAQARAAVTPTALHAAYLREKSRFENPEQVTVAYVLLTASALADRIHPTLNDLLTLYAERESRYTTPPQWNVSMILIRSGTTAATRRAARERALKLLAALSHGARFAALARRDSEDPETAPHGGALGWITPKEVPSAMARALGHMKVGAVRGPISTPFGYEIVKLRGLRAGQRMSFQAARPQLIRLYRAQAEVRLYRRLVRQMGNLAFEDDTTLTPVSRTLGLPVREIAGITPAGGAGLAGQPAVIHAIFKPSVLQGGLNSAPIRLSGHRAVVLRVVSRIPARPKPFGQVRLIIARQLVAQAARQATRRAARRAARLLEHETAVTHVEGEPVRGPFTLMRSEPPPAGFPAALVPTVFRLPNTPTPSGPWTIHVVPMAGHGEAVVEAGPVQIPPFRALAGEALESWTKSAESAESGLEMQLFLNELERVGHVRINPKALKKSAL
jgi:peptidyl-prolyl cis-trans isomerase D